MHPLDLIEIVHTEVRENFGVKGMWSGVQKLNTQNIFDSEELMPRNCYYLKAYYYACSQFRAQCSAHDCDPESVILEVTKTTTDIYMYSKTIVTIVGLPFTIQLFANCCCP